MLLAASAIGLALLFVLRIAIASYMDERSDFVRTPPADISLHPQRTESSGLQQITFAAHDGTTLAGWYAPARNRAAIILVHGTSADRSSLLPETRILALDGFGVLAFDLPGQGASEGRTLWGMPERQAISAAIDWLSQRREVDPQRIGGFGLSMGAYVLTQAAALDPRLRAVVLAASPSDVVEQNWLASGRWGLLTQIPSYWALRVSGMPLDMRPKDVVGSISPRAVFIIGGDLDGLVPLPMTQQMHQAAREPKEFWIVHGAHHGNYLQSAPQEYPRRLIEFYRRTLID